MFDPAQKRRQKRLLACDGGGIMGMISLQFLKRMEDQLRPLSGKGDAFRLSDFFDYFGGTSTGAIIATGLALGHRVDDLIEFYEKNGSAMFQRAWFWRRLWYGYEHTPLTRKLKDVIGDKTIRELQADGSLKSLLLIVTRNATTDKAWPISSNPHALYNDPRLDNCNLDLKLWQLVRASTAAPTYYRPEIITVGDETFQFVDGAITAYNNPALLLYKMATLPEYGGSWATGEDRMMLVSIGTGKAFDTKLKVRSHGRMLHETATSITGEVLRGVNVANDVTCRTIGRCVHGNQIDSELGDLVRPGPLLPMLGRYFLYGRYDVDLSAKGLDNLGVGDIPAGMLTMDNVEALPQLERIGQVAAERQVNLPKQFATFMPEQAAAAA